MFQFQLPGSNPLWFVLVGLANLLVALVVLGVLVRVSRRVWRRVADHVRYDDPDDTGEETA